MARSTPENKAKRKIKDALEAWASQDPRRHVYKLVWNAGAGYGADTVDAIGVIGGVAVAIEVKRFDGLGRATARQTMFLDEWRDARGKSFLIDSKEALEEFVAWLRHLSAFLGHRG